LAGAGDCLAVALQVGAYFFHSSAPLSGCILGNTAHHELASYCGLHVLASGGGPTTLAIDLAQALGPAVIKPVRSTTSADQFTSKNQHLIERAFSYFYLSINAGSSISIYFCPIWLNAYGPRVAFGLPVR